MLAGLWAGCSDSDAGAGGSGGTSKSVSMEGSVQIGGDQSVAGRFVQPAATRQPSCALLAAEGGAEEDPLPGTFSIPGPYFGTPLEPSGDAYAATLNIPAASYEGPGTYRNGSGEPPQIRGQIVVGDIMDGPRYYIDEGEAEAIIEADGSGIVTFVDIPQDRTQDPGAATSISGSVSWDCID